MATLSVFIRRSGLSPVKRGAGITGAALVLLVLLSGALSPVFAGEAPSISLKLEDVVPADTLLFVKCSGVDQLLAEGKNLDLFRLWREPEVQGFFADAIKKMHEVMGSKEKSDFPFKKVWQLLKGNISLACSPRFTIFHEGAAPSMALGMEMGHEREAFLETIEKFIDEAAGKFGLEQGEFDYRGFNIGFIGQPKNRWVVCYTTLQNLFVATINRYYLQDILDCHLDRETFLSSNPSFNQCQNKVGGESVDAMAFINFEPLIDIVKPVCPYEVEEWLDMLGLKGMDAVCLASTIEGGGARDSFFFHCPGEKKGLLKVLSPRPVSHKNLRRTPSDALFFMDLAFDPELALEEVDRFIREGIPEGYKEFRQGLELCKKEIGLDLQKDILEPLGSEIAYFVTMPQSGGLAMIPDIIVTVSLDDEKGFNILLDKIVSMFQQHIEIVESVFDGRTMRHIKPAQPEIPFNPAFIVDEGCLVAASSPMTLKKYLNWLKEGGPGLDQSEAFKRAVSSVPENASFLEYVNLQRCVEMGYGMLAPFLPSVLSQTDMPFDAAMLPMVENITKHVSNAVTYMVVDDEGILMSGRWPLGFAAVLSLAASSANYMVEENLIQGMALQGAEMGQKKKSSASSLETARSLMGAGQYEAAEELYTVYIDAHPGDKNVPSALMNRGYCRLAQGRYADGVKDYKEAAESDPKQRPLAFYNIACGYSRMNEKEKALKYLEKAIDEGYENASYMENDPDFENIRNEAKYQALKERLARKP